MPQLGENENQPVLRLVVLKAACRENFSAQQNRSVAGAQDTDQSSIRGYPILRIRIVCRWGCAKFSTGILKSRRVLQLSSA